MPPLPVFSPAGEGDIPRIQALARSIWTEYYPRILSPEQIEYMLERIYGADALRADMRGGAVYELVRVDGSPVGYLAYALESGGKSLRLDKLYLEAALRGCGLGRKILERVRDAAVNSGAAEITLRVNKRNETALAAYRKFGFEVEGPVIEDIGGGYVMDDFRLRAATSPPIRR